jgi:hypothetical protein
MIIRFPTNIAQRLRMRSLEGKPVESQFGGMQHLFTAEEGVFYVSDKVGGILADQFRKLGVKPGDPVEITKAETGRGPERCTQWMVAVDDPREGQPAAAAAMVVANLPDPPSELEKQLKASIKMVEARKLVQSAQAAPPAAPAWAEYLVTQSNVLIDAYSQVLKHAAKYENVRGEDVRSIFLSTFINVAKGGRNAA